MAFVYAYFFSDFLCFDMSLLLLTVILRGYLISIAYCLFFIFHNNDSKDTVGEIKFTTIK